MIPTDKHEAKWPWRMSVCNRCGNISYPGVTGGKCPLEGARFTEHDRVEVDLAPLHVTEAQTIRRAHQAIRAVLHEHWEVTLRLAQVATDASEPIRAVELDLLAACIQKDREIATEALESILEEINND